MRRKLLSSAVKLAKVLTVGGDVSLLTVTEVDVAVLPVTSRADAVSTCEPPLRFATVSVALPPLNAALPIVVDPSRKLTCPTGVPNVDVTVAVSVIGC